MKHLRGLTHYADTYLYGFLLALMLIMPLHAFLAISLGHSFGHQAIWQAWKEIGLVIAAFAALWILVAQKPKRRELLSRVALLTASAYILLTLGISIVTQDLTSYSFLLGTKTSLAFLGVFIVAQVARFTSQRWRTLIQALLIVVSGIGLFAIAQVHLLPADFLITFGYGPTTIPAFHLVDPAVSAIRIIATFSGPNQLGSFMIIPLTLSFWFLLRKRWIAAIPFALSGFMLFHSYSRSAWIGAVVALLITLGLWLKGWWRLTLIALIAVLGLVGYGLNTTSQDKTNDLRYYLSHGQIIDGKAQGSDQSRLNNAQYGLEIIQEQPLGHGLGTAGPASQKSDQPIITENSYLQIGIESGVIGLILFIATIVAAIVALFRRRSAVEEALPLIAIMGGLAITNLFLHTWADSATALVVWALIGYCLAAKPKEMA